MSRGRRIALIAGGSIAGLLLLVVITGVVVVQTAWFQDKVRVKIVSSIEEATGGKVDIRSFTFDWHKLRAEVRNLVLHGLEPAGAAPLFQANLVQVDLKLLSPFKGFVDIAYLMVDTPRANVMVFPDGRTNIPEPKLPHKSDKTGLETIVNLAIGKFDLLNSSVQFAEQKAGFDATGSNLRAHLDYNRLNPSYTGELQMNPLVLKSGGNPPVNVSVKLPVTMEKDKISVANAELATPESKVIISGTMDHLVAPRSSAHINAQVALEEVKRTLGLSLPLDTARGPRILNADVTATMDENYVRIQSGRLTLGQSNLEASGTLKDSQKPAAVQFNTTLALGEIGRLLKVAVRPEGVVKAGGNATLRPNNDYLVAGNIDARNVAIRQGSTQLTGINLDSTFTADPHRIELAGLRLNALGGGFTGNASLAEMEQFRIAGTLHNFDIDQLARTFAGRSLGYDGVISGPVQADGNIKNPSAVVARANLGIAPGARGVPVTGRLSADYNGRGDTVTLARSFLQLPHTRIDLSGSLGQQIQVNLVSRDLADFKPLGEIPVVLNNGGAATVNATITGKLSAPNIAAQAQLTNFAADGRQFDRLTANVNANPRQATVANAVLMRGPLQAQFAGTVGLTNWKAPPSSPLRADASVRNADLKDVLALAGQSDIDMTGALTADAHVAGTIGSPTGNADLSVINGAIEGEKFDSLAARAVMTPDSIDVPSLQLVAGASRIDATANYQHALNDLQHGNLRAHVASNQVQLAQFQSLLKDRPGLAGILSLKADAAAAVQPGASGTEVVITNIDGSLSARDLQMEGRNLGDLTATASTAGSAVQYNVNSNFAGSTVRVNGRTLLTGNHDTTASALIANLPIDRVLAVAGRRDLPVTGTLSANAQVAGTLQDPRAVANLNIADGSAYEEPFSRLQTSINYSAQLIDVPTFRLEKGGSLVDLTASFAHPKGDLENGDVKFHVRSNEIQLTQVKKLQESSPGLGGILQVTADGAASIRKSQTPMFSTLNANISARGISMNQKTLGDLTATAETKGGEVDFQLTSDIARANVRGSGRMGLAGDYPLNAQLSFNNLTYSGLAPLLKARAGTFDGSAEGQVTLSGPLNRTSDLRGNLQIAKLEAHSAPATTGRKPRVNFELHNAGPIVASLERSLISIQSAHIAGPSTDISVTGTASIEGQQPLNLRAEGNVKLEILEAFDPDIFSSGAVVLNAAVSGTMSKPAVNGRLQLQNASLNLADAPNGLSNANGIVNFTGTEAVIQNLTGETGGGKIALTGFVGYAGSEMQIRLTATADKVSVGYPESVTTQISAKIALNGTTSRSLVSGNVTINDVALHSHSDIGSMLSSAATPPPAATANTGFLGGMRFDVRIRTAPDVQFRTTLTQNLQADADLTLRGSPDHPGMLGRVVVTAGEVVFFGSKYTIDQGIVNFYNPQKINPILNINLETSVQGIDVAISVSGPLDRMKLTYRSDPPMQFSDLVSLLASGKPPTSDPVLAARAPVAPQQNFQQVGASTVFSQAVANPVSGRLQRLFGVSRLKIDPQIIGTSNTPQATLTLQQQITRDLTFTYIQDVTQSNPQIIRVEWAIDPQFSAIAQRDLNGIFDLDFYYKKRFR